MLPLLSWIAALILFMGWCVYTKLPDVHNALHPQVSTAVVQPKPKTPPAAHPQATPPVKQAEPVAPKEIAFVIERKEAYFYIEGNFTNRTQLQELQLAFSAANATLFENEVHTDAHFHDSGAVALVQKLAPYVANMEKSKLTYADGRLYIEGIRTEVPAAGELCALFEHHAVACVDRSMIATAAHIAVAADENETDSTPTLAVSKEDNVSGENNTSASDIAPTNMPQSTPDDTSDFSSLANNTPLAQEEQEEVVHAREDIAQHLSVDAITFDTAKAELTPQGKQTVDKLAAILQRYPHVRVRIEGHTDSDGNAAFNLKLSQQRAETIRNELAALGIDPSRIEAIGYGDTRPIASEVSQESKQRNRRVEIIIIGE